jgi:hypothetical protein
MILSVASYYRARYYDPAAGRLLSEDPTRFGSGDVNSYAFVLNSPSNLIDPLGWNGQTWGPITIYWDQQNMTATQIAAEKTHETQHRCDFWNGNQLFRSCDFLESRGFAAEIPVLQQRITELKQKKTLTIAEQQELNQLIDELDRARGLANPSGFQIHFYCHPPPLSDPFNGPPPPGWALQ